MESSNQTEPGRRERIIHAKWCLLWALRDVPEDLRTSPDRELSLRLAMDRDLKGFPVRRTDSK